MATNTIFQGHGPMQFHSLHMYLLVYFPFLVAIKPNKYILISPVFVFLYSMAVVRDQMLCM